jgi:hypothetical protein
VGMGSWMELGDLDSGREVRGSEVVSTTTECGRERMRCRREVESMGSCGSPVS